MIVYDKVTPVPWGDTDKSVSLIKTSIGWVSFADKLNFRRYSEGTGWVPITMRDLAKIENELPKRKRTIAERIKLWLDKIRQVGIYWNYGVRNGKE